MTGQLLLSLRRAIPGLLLIAGAVALAMALSGRARQQPAQGERTGYDPLSLTEQDRARQIALADASVSAQLAAAARDELLLVERHEETKAVYTQGSWPRRADVLFYLYDTDTLLSAVVNLTAGQLDQAQSAQQVQPPLTPAETNLARELALADPAAGAALREEYRRATGEDLENADQLRTYARVFWASAMPDVALGQAASCGLHRCGQLLFSAGPNHRLSTLPIVNLSTQTVTLLTR